MWPHSLNRSRELQSSARSRILEQWHYPVLEYDLCELPGDDVSPVPDAVHFSGVVDSIAHVLDAPRLGGKQPFRAGHVISMDRLVRADNWASA
jgi:hypothetical protein